MIDKERFSIIEGRLDHLEDELKKLESTILDNQHRLTLLESEIDLLGDRLN